VLAPSLLEVHPAQQVVVARIVAQAVEYRIDLEERQLAPRTIDVAALQRGEGTVAVSCSRPRQGLVVGIRRGESQDPCRVVTAVREHRSSWHLSPRARRVGLGAAVLVVVVALLPWPFVVTGRFVAAPALQVSLVAPSGGTVEQVYASCRQGALSAASLTRRRPARIFWLTRSNVLST